MHKHGVAIIGAGIGAEHLTAYRALPDRYDVRWICDLDLPRAEGIAKDGPQVTQDIEHVLADPLVGLVDICLPPHLHLDAMIKVLRSGRDAICEKPLVTSLADCDRLERVVEETGQRIFPVFQYRYGRAGTQIRMLKAAGLTGSPFVASLETHWRRDADYYAVDWRGTWNGEQGGAVLGHAIHSHDWLSFAFGPVASVYAHTATRVNDIEVEDCAALSIRMKNGALVTSSVTLGAADDTSRLRFVFEGLTATSGSDPYRPADDTWTFTARSADQAAIDATIDIQTPNGGFAGLFEAVADCLDGRESNVVTLHDARQSLEFVTAVYASAASNAPVSLPIPKDHAFYSGWRP